ncbi:hypothetical protein T11_1802 [Trichinella zimbabwensis]|uniref:Uncharacterized protein n=1 Tax=Trichinella zimbabwensis TaxID=268475 RepID=A0A0V1G9K4_9BILA|nr:hypothetical protein T11_1802 [Trichinella zimbabwensis]
MVYFKKQSSKYYLYLRKFRNKSDCEKVIVSIRS